MLRPVGKGPTVLAVGAQGVGCLEIVLSLSLSLSVSLIKTEILSQRTVKPKTPN